MCAKENVDHRKMGKFSLLQEGNFQLKFSTFFQAKRGRPSRAPAAAAQRHSDEPAVTNVTSAKARSEAGLETEMSLLGARHRSLSPGKRYHRERPRCVPGNVSTKDRVSGFCVVRSASQPHQKAAFQTNS